MTIKESPSKKLDPIAVYPVVEITTAKPIEGCEEVTTTPPNNAVNDDITHASSSTTIIPPEVSDEKRTVTNKNWAISFLSCYFIFFISCGLIFIHAHPKYKIMEDGKKVISDHFRPKVERCCNDIYTAKKTPASWGLCSKLDTEDGGRRLKSGRSTFDGDEGIFDAFLEQPGILVGILGFVMIVAMCWVALLQAYAKQIVIATEVMKVVVLLIIAFIVLGYARIFVIILCIGYGALAYSRLEDLMNAANIISLSAEALERNPKIVLGLIGLKIFYALQAALLVVTICASFEIVEVTKSTSLEYSCPIADIEIQETCQLTNTFECDGSNCMYSEPIKLEIEACAFVNPSFLRSVNTFQIGMWIWATAVMQNIQLYIIASIVGSWHFSGNRLEFSRALQRSVMSIGSLAFAGTITAFLDLVRRRHYSRWFWWVGPQAIFLVCLCIASSCILHFAHIYTKFAVVIHAFTGLSFQKSARKCHSMMRRRFVGGFITDWSSEGVLGFGSFIFSLLVAFLTWTAFDLAFNCSSFENYGTAWYWIFVIILSMIYPIMGVVIVIMLNAWYQRSEQNRQISGQDNFQHIWIPPLAAAFVGCIARLFFNYVGRVILNIIDTIFVCVGIDDDNGINRSLNLFSDLVKKMPDYIAAKPVNQIDPEMPTSQGTFERELVPQATLYKVDKHGNVDDDKSFTAEIQHKKMPRDIFRTK